MPQRFWRHVEKTPTCWLWRGAVSTSGYGRFIEAKRMEQAHRVAFRLTHGRDAQGSDLCHTCDVRLCVNPAHLVEGDRSWNMRDAARKGRVVIGTAKVTIEQGREIQRRALAGERTRDLAREFRVSPPVISRIKYKGPPKIGHSWKEV